MILTEKETTAIKDLQTQEQSCIEKFNRYSSEAKDTVLKDLFKSLEKKENQKNHTIAKVLYENLPTSK